MAISSLGFSEEYLKEHIPIHPETYWELTTKEFQDHTQNPASITIAIDVLYEEGKFDDFEYNLMNSLFQNPSDKAKAASLMDQWENKNYDYKSGKGYLSGAILSLTYSPNEFWDGRALDAQQENPAAVDAGGFVIGAALAAMTGRDTSQSIAAGVMGGLTASLGAAAAVGNVLRKAGTAAVRLWRTLFK